MRTYEVDNVDEALPLLIAQLDREGAAQETRNGPVVGFLSPVAVTYRYPYERFVMHTSRRNNVAFLVMEGLWMLGGRNDVEWLARFNEGMRKYSDNGVSFHGAYGYRLRHGRVDQLNECAYMLKLDPTTRRAVAQIWDKDIDLCSTSKDIPCNDLIMFRVRNKYLDMAVCNRSNDLIWGMCGANAAHFSMIHEYVAAKAGFYMGEYTQFSNNLHMYVDTPNLDEYAKIPLLNDNWYSEKRHLIPLVSSIHQFDTELQIFMGMTGENRRLSFSFEEPFFETVAKPLYNFWITRKYLKMMSDDVWRKDIMKIEDDAVRALAVQWVASYETA